jgi:putative Holliday junction resolvase
MRLLGIDYGHKKIGLALSDESGRFAFPHATLPNDKFLISKIKELCVREKIGLIVVGESLGLSGQPNPIMKQIEKLEESLRQEIGLPLAREREFFTSWEAKRIIDEGQTDPLTDARAAALILKSYIDRRGNEKNN